ncbi:MAG: hypothetical protein KGJ80_08125 [Chloroflexota bacterium]|nr:hypothetical protein [Chloroflexota bacterium]
MKNFVPLPYRQVAVRQAGFDLTERALKENLLGREAYRRTEFIVLRREGKCAIARIEKASPDELFSPITSVQLFAAPEECRWIDDASIDVGLPTQLALKARALGLSRDQTLIVHGKYEHVNFIHHPDPIIIRVVDVVPPEPAKLLTMANQVLEFAEGLPAIELRFEPIDLTALARAHPAPAYLFPCQASGIEVGAPIYFLDTRPRWQEWTMIGCERCAQLHRHFYDREPEQVDYCPSRRTTPDGILTLTKCCLLETEIETEGNRAVVPWGANLGHVQAALTYLAGRTGD